MFAVFFYSFIYPVRADTGPDSQLFFGAQFGIVGNLGYLCENF